MSTIQPNACLRCGETMTPAGVEQIRVGGTGGGWKLLFGELAEVGEEMIPLEMHVCTNCRKIEFRQPA
jgi:hypothetical protein